MNSQDTPPATRIIITGPTGAGKSAAGQALARLLGWAFLDLDATVTTSAGQTSARIFASEGEEGWRRREAAALARAVTTESVVIATGAGALEATGAREVVARSGAWTIALLVEPAVALSRIQSAAASMGLSVGESRPMLTDDDPLARLRALHDRRAPLYTLADDQVDASGPLEQVVARALAGFILSGRMPAGDAISHTCRVNAGASYDAVTGWATLAELPPRLRALDLPQRLNVVTDSSVGALYAEPLARMLRAGGFAPEVFTIPAGEASKSRESLDAIHDWLAERRVARDEALLALGGGVTGDLAGFAAATWLRGIPFIQLPTSLLAQVDASIGGKVAIDHPRGKNLIGAFYQPRLVVAGTATLLTLPERQRVEGWAEVIKHGVALDADYFTSIEDAVDSLLALRPAPVTRAIAASVALKARIAGSDEREREGGQRALLNFGHTLGHSIESVTGYGAWLHGEAVSAGMVFAARLGVLLGVTPPEVATRLESLLTRFGLPTRLDGLSARDLLHATLWDKKARGGHTRWVLLTGLGSAKLYGAASEDALRETLTEQGASA